MTNKKSTRIKRIPGDVVIIDLGSEYHSYGRVLESTIGFYDVKTQDELGIEEIIQYPIFFNVWVMDSAITKGTWPILGHNVLSDSLLVKPKFYKQDPINGKLYITTNGDDEIPATYEECSVLECAAVWEADHIVDILNEHFTGKKSDWFNTVAIDKSKIK